MTSSLEREQVGNRGREEGALGGIFERLRSRVMRPLPTLSAPFPFGGFENADSASFEHGTRAAAKPSVDRGDPSLRVPPALRLSFAPDNLARERVDGSSSSPDVTARSILQRARVA